MQLTLTREVCLPLLIDVIWCKLQTKQEKDAKEDVVLPYEDVSSLGEIHYVRESEEDYDSDEDPDDDLDI